VHLIWIQQVNGKAIGGQEMANPFERHVAEICVCTRLDVKVKGELIVVEQQGHAGRKFVDANVCARRIASTLHPFDEQHDPPDAAAHLPSETRGLAREGLVRLRHDGRVVAQAIESKL
jgi:hypothetical protein